MIALFRAAICISAVLSASLMLAACRTPTRQASAPAPGSSSGHEQHAAAPPAVRYPVARKDGTVEVLHGVDVPDPYRWLEDSDSRETRAWITAENEVTDAFLARIAARDAIKKRLTALWDYPRFDIPVERGGRYFYTHNSGLQNQPALYWQASLQAEPKLLLDPNTLSSEGTTAVKDFVPSENGKRVAYGLSRAGSDWTQWRVIDVDSGQDLPDRINWVKFTSIAWLKDGSGFFYSRYAEPKAGGALEQSNYYNKLYFHRLGDAQDADRLVYSRDDEKQWSFSPTVSDDGRYLVITVSKGTDPKFSILYQDLSRPSAPIHELLMGFDALYGFVGSRGSKFWFVTDRDAPRRRLVALDLNDPTHTLHEVIAQETDTLQSVTLSGGKFLANYLHDAHSRLALFASDGKLEENVQLPALGTVYGPLGRAASSEVFFSFEGFAAPREIHRYDVAQRSGRVFRSAKVSFDPAAFETQQVFYTSKDGTRVPMFLTRKKGSRTGADAPCLLYGYGGFGISLTPGFRPENLAWLELGGLLAVPNLRGGGEYGEAWHEAGKRSRKQNVFDDFIAAAEYLIAAGLTSPAKLAIQGRSNGGLLVGAMIAQRPELFGATLPGVGVMDMLRFHKFTIGWAWVDDYGSPDDAEDFRALYAYSPLHNLKAGTHYPATLITTADHDDRVVPAHSFKFAAALQAAQGGPAPVLIRIETQAGHGQGKSTAQRIDEFADQWAFLVDRLGVAVPH